MTTVRVITIGPNSGDRQDLDVPVTDVQDIWPVNGTGVDDWMYGCWLPDGRMGFVNATDLAAAGVMAQ